jgi:hypothetical protein
MQAGHAGTDTPEERALLVVQGNTALAAAQLAACSMGWTPEPRREELQPACSSLIARTPALADFQQHHSIRILRLPELREFRIEACLGKVMVRYPGVPLNLRKTLRVCHMTHK